MIKAQESYFKDSIWVLGNTVNNKIFDFIYVVFSHQRYRRIAQKGYMYVFGRTMPEDKLYRLGKWGSVSFVDIPDLILEVNTDGIFRYWNKKGKMKFIFNYDSEYCSFSGITEVT